MGKFGEGINLMIWRFGVNLKPPNKNITDIIIPSMQKATRVQPPSFLFDQSDTAQLLAREKCGYHGDVQVFARKGFVLSTLHTHAG